MIQWRKDQGPVFGNEELVFMSNMTRANTSYLKTYTNVSNSANKEYLLGERYVSLHAIEVLSTGGKSEDLLFS